MKVVFILFSCLLSSAGVFFWFIDLLRLCVHPSSSLIVRQPAALAAISPFVHPAGQLMSPSAPPVGQRETPDRQADGCSLFGELRVVCARQSVQRARLYCTSRAGMCVCVVLQCSVTFMCPDSSCGSSADDSQQKQAEWFVHLLQHRCSCFPLLSCSSVPSLRRAVEEMTPVRADRVEMKVTELLHDDVSV